MTYRNPLYGWQHSFPNSAASVNIKLLSSIISPSFGPRTHELLPCGYKWRKVVKLFRKTKSKFCCYGNACFGIDCRVWRIQPEQLQFSRIAHLCSGAHGCASRRLLNCPTEPAAQL